MFLLIYFLKEGEGNKGPPRFFNPHIQTKLYNNVEGHT